MAATSRFPRRKLSTIPEVVEEALGLTIPKYDGIQSTLDSVLNLPTRAKGAYATELNNRLQSEDVVVRNAGLSIAPANLTIDSRYFLPQIPVDVFENLPRTDWKDAQRLGSLEQDLEPIQVQHMTRGEPQAPLAAHIYRYRDTNQDVSCVLKFRSVPTKFGAISRAFDELGESLALKQDKNLRVGLQVHPLSFVVKVYLTVTFRKYPTILQEWLKTHDLYYDPDLYFGRISEQALEKSIETIRKSYKDLSLKIDNLIQVFDTTLSQMQSPDNDLFLDCVGNFLGSALAHRGLSPFHPLLYGSLLSVEPKKVSVSLRPQTIGGVVVRTVNVPTSAMFMEDAGTLSFMDGLLGAGTPDGKRSYFEREDTSGVAESLLYPRLEMLAAHLMQIVLGMAIYTSYFDVVHNNFFADNIMLRKTNVEYLYYQLRFMDLNGQKRSYTLRIPTYGYILQLIDFGKSSIRISKNDTFVSRGIRKLWQEQMDLNRFALYQREFVPSHGNFSPNPSNPSADLRLLAFSIYAAAANLGQEAFASMPSTNHGLVVMNDFIGSTMRCIRADGTKKRYFDWTNVYDKCYESLHNVTLCKESSLFYLDGLDVQTCPCADPLGYLALGILRLEDSLDGPKILEPYIVTDLDEVANETVFQIPELINVPFVYETITAVE